MYKTIEKYDKDIADALYGELRRQRDQVELIASENIVSEAVLEAQGSVLTNKYAEGYPGRRYYGGCEYADRVESLARDRACELFGCSEANVQPHSGAQANQAVMLALLNPGDPIIGMDLASGGHLTHGASFNLSGRWFQAVTYGVDRDSGYIDEEALEKLVQEYKPRLIITGGSAYARVINFARFREIADQVGAYLLADVAHYAGLIVTGLYPNPFPHAHVVTTTTHKTLRGPRGGMILTQDTDLGKKINSAVFPGLQGGPLMHVIAAKAVAFKEALQPSFKSYAQAVLHNARTLAQALKQHGLSIVTDGTDCHLVLVDLRPMNITGKMAQHHLECAGITCNKNAIPFDPEKPVHTSGIRLGTPVITTRGFREKECKILADQIVLVLKDLASNTEKQQQEVEKSVQKTILDLCHKFPIYKE